MDEIARKNIIVKYLLEVQDKASKPYAKANKAQNQFSKGFGDLRKSLLRGAGVAAVVASVVKFGNESLKLASKLEQTRISINTFTQDAAKTRDIINEITNLNARTPFEQDELLNSTKTLLGFGVSVDEVITTVERLGKISAGTGAPLQNLSLVFGQVRAQGKAFTQDLNQFINNGVPIFDILAQSIGTTTGNIRTLASQGKITYDVLNKAVVEATGLNGKFADTLEAQSQSFEGLKSTARSLFDLVKTEVGQVLLPIFKELTRVSIDGLNSTLDQVREINNTPVTIGIKIAAGIRTARVIAEQFQIRFAAILNNLELSAGRLKLRFEDLLTFGRRRDSIGQRFTDIRNAIAANDAVIKALGGTIGDIYRKSIQEILGEQELATKGATNLAKALGDDAGGVGKAAKFAAGSLGELKAQLAALNNELENFTIIGSSRFSELQNEIELLTEDIAMWEEGLRVVGLEMETIGARTAEFTDTIDRLRISLQETLGGQQVNLEIAQILGDEGEIARINVRIAETNLLLARRSGNIDDIRIATAELIKAQRDLNDLDEKQRLDSLNRAGELINAVGQIGQAIADSVSGVYDVLLARLDAAIENSASRLIGLQALQATGNQKLLELEEERLASLTNARQKAFEEQQRIARQELALTQSVAIADGIRLLLSASNPLQAVLSVATIIGAIGKLTTGLRSSIPSFKGGKDDDSGKGRVLTNKVKKNNEFLAFVGKNERIFNNEDSALLRGHSNRQVVDMVRNYENRKLKSLEFRPNGNTNVYSKKIYDELVRGNSFMENLSVEVTNDEDGLNVRYNRLAKKRKKLNRVRR